MANPGTMKPHQSVDIQGSIIVDFDLARLRAALGMK